jgi:hypothetical protein
MGHDLRRACPPVEQPLGVNLDRPVQSFSRRVLHQRPFAGVGRSWNRFPFTAGPHVILISLKFVQQFSGMDARVFEIGERPAAGRFGTWDQDRACFMLGCPIRTPDRCKLDMAKNPPV